MALSRIVAGWVIVAGWLALWSLVERRGAVAGKGARRAHLELVGEALVVTLFGALWFGSLGAGGWWLLFLLVGLLREWPVVGTRAALRVIRFMVAGGLLAWCLGT